MSTWERISEFGSKRFEGSQVMETSGLKYVIYTLAVGIAIAVILLIIDNLYPFLPINPISGPSAQARAGKYFWSTEGENLVVPASESPTVVADTYTMTVQVMIGDSRTPSIGKFRHVAHRGSNPLGLSASAAGPSGHAGIQESDIPASESSYKQTGLPAVMNPGLFLDKYKNDLHVFVHTKGKEGAMDVVWLESMTIEDLPLATPLTLGVVCNGKTLEVYVNCRLYSTLILKGTPYLPKAANQWFGRYGAYPMSGLVKNLGLWSAALDASDYIQVCRSASFDKNNLPASCPTAK